MANEFASLKAMVEKFGETEVHKLAEKGLADRQYRKGRNLRQAAIMDLVKQDKRYAELTAKAKAVVDAKVGKKS